MDSKKIRLRLLLITGFLILLTACCGTNKNVYTAPPAREIPLDSVKTEIDPFRMKPDPDSFLVNFTVPGDSSCPVKIEFFTSQHKLERLITDSVYSAGPHRIFWGRLDNKGDSIRFYRSYYYKFRICDSSYNKSFYYRRELY